MTNFLVSFVVSWFAGVSLRHGGFAELRHTVGKNRMLIFGSPLRRLRQRFALTMLAAAIMVEDEKSEDFWRWKVVWKLPVKDQSKPSGAYWLTFAVLCVILAACFVLLLMVWLYGADPACWGVIAGAALGIPSPAYDFRFRLLIENWDAGISECVFARSVSPDVDSVESVLAHMHVLRSERGEIRRVRVNSDKGDRIVEFLYDPNVATYKQDSHFGDLLLAAAQRRYHRETRRKGEEKSFPAGGLLYRLYLRFRYGAGVNAILHWGKVEVSLQPDETFPGYRVAVAANSARPPHPEWQLCGADVWMHDGQAWSELDTSDVYDSQDLEHVCVQAWQSAGGVCKAGGSLFGTPSSTDIEDVRSAEVGI